MGCGISSSGTRRSSKPRHLFLALLVSASVTFGFTRASTAAPSIYNLGSLTGGESETYGINASGQLVGFSYTDSSYHAILYTGSPGTDGVMLDLGISTSQAFAINTTGQITGMLGGNGVYRAFLYTGIPGSGGAMTNLGSLGGALSWGNAINSRGQVVGTSSTAQDRNSRLAFLYTPALGGGSMVDLGTLGGSQALGNG